MERIKKIINGLLKLISTNEMRILPAHLAFFLVLSVVPIITLIGFVSSFFSISLDSIINSLQNNIPKEITDLLLPFISGKGVDIGIGLSMFLVFLVASNGSHSIIIASNTLYKIENSDYLKRRIKALFMTALLVFLFIFIVVVLAFGNNILSFILDLKVFKNIGDNIYNIFVFIKWPIAYLLILFSLKVIFTFAPDKKIESRYVNKGVQFTTLGWMIVTAIYSFYVSNIANYDIFYGGLSNVIILMMWVYILAYILVLGIAINANSYRLEKNTSDNDK